MKTHFLFPNSYKKIGWILFVPSLIMELIVILFDINLDDYLQVKVLALYQDNFNTTSQFFSIIENSICDELLTVFSIVGGLLICFSKLKTEDEYISKIRYESLVWATYLNYGLIVFFTLFLYGMPYLNVLFYNMFTLILFFIIRFHYLIYQLNTTSDDE
ncbi:MAG: hypothetical protein V4648_04995 [Bacteroidota bacterium]